MIAIFTEADICTFAKDWPLDKIDIKDMQTKNYIEKLSGTVVVVKGDNFKVIKHRNGEKPGDVRHIAGFYRFIKDDNDQLLEWRNTP